MAAVFDREAVGREMCGPECGNNLIALCREVDQVGREGTQDSVLAKCPSCNLVKKVLVEFGKERRVDVFVTRQIDFATEERHDMPMEANFDGSGVEEVPLGAPEQRRGQLKVMRPCLDATDAGALEERRGAYAD
jgi:hypothetical protein